MKSLIRNGWVVLWMTVVFCSTAEAQPAALLKKDIIFEHPDEKLELSQQSINCMIQDWDGYLWLGTWTGLMMYDGYTTTVFQSDNSSAAHLQSNKITSLLEDTDGNIWVGTLMGGLYQYNKYQETFVNHQFDPDSSNTLSNNNVWSIIEDKTGKLWIGTENGLNCFDPNTRTWLRYHADPRDARSLSFDFVTSLYLDSRDFLWIGTERGMNRLDLSRPDRGFSHINYSEDQENSILHNYIYKITSYKTAEQEVICWSTKKGMKLWQGGSLTNYQYEDRSGSFSFFRNIYAYQHQNKYLLLGSEMGLSVFDIQKKAFTKFFGNYDKRVQLSHNTVTSIFMDRTGVLWVGTKKGINKFDTYDKNFALYLTDSFDPTKSIITGLQSTPSGQVWVSTMGGGVFTFNQRKSIKNGAVSSLFTKYKLGEQPANDFSEFVQTLYTDDAGNIWIGSAGAGVYTFHEDDVPPSTTVISDYRNFRATGGKKDRLLTDNYIMSLSGSRDGGIWVGTWSGGLNKIMPDGKVLHFQQPELIQVPLVVLHEDASGVLWVGTRGEGLLKAQFSGNKLVSIKAFQSGHQPGAISNDFINTIYEDQAGRFWVGTEGGLNHFDKEQEVFELFNTQEGEQVDVIVGILEDEDGKLWLSHWKGITVMDPDQKKHPVISHYDRQDRIQGGFFYNNVCMKDTADHLFFGGANGFNIIHPEKVNKNPYPPKVVLRDFRLFNTPVSLHKAYNGRTIVSKPLSETEEIHLQYDENSLSLEFAALHFSVPEKNRYAYRMRGFDEVWKYTSADRRYANYTNLPHGHYVFEVKASNNDGVWSDEVEQLRIVISPPWYKTVYARVGYVLIAILILYLFRKFIIIRTNYINDIRLERLNRENLERLNKAKLQFFTNVSHEFRTPLTLIIGPLEKMINSGEGGIAFKDQLAIINRNSQRLLRLVNQLLDFRKAETGKLKLKVAEGNMVRFLQEVKLSFEGLAGQKNIRFIFRASAEVIPAWFDRDQCEKIFFNLLSNAFNHTPDDGEILLEVYEAEDSVWIRVEDNGTGIKSENFKKIFRRFYSEEDAWHPGTGIGLALTKTLVELHHGKISVESVENEYARFTVSLPLGYKHFKESEIIPDFKDSECIGNYVDLHEEFLMPVEPQRKNTDFRKLGKILVVEDNPEVRSYIRSVFDGKYRVLEAENGQEGRELAEKENPDLIISDVMMPVLDGINLCKQIKENIKTSHIPVILLTARTSLIFRIEGLENGADDYINKPFNHQVLALKVRNLIKARKQLQQSFQDNTLAIEPKKVTLTAADETFIKNALDSIEQNMSNSAFSVEDLGKDTGMSRMQLYRKLKALTGQSANEFIRSIRLKRAAQLLAQQQLTIAEVTYEVGFTDLQYFRNCFKKQFRVTPSEYAANAEPCTKPVMPPQIKKDA